MADNISEHLEKLYDWIHIIDKTGADSVDLNINSFAEIKIIAKYQTSSGILNLPMVLDTNSAIEGGTIFSAIGYIDDLEIHVIYKVEFSNSGVSKISLLNGTYLKHIPDIIESGSEEDSTIKIWEYTNFNKERYVNYGNWDASNTSLNVGNPRPPATSNPLELPGKVNVTFTKDGSDYTETVSIDLPDTVEYGKNVDWLGFVSNTPKSNTVKDLVVKLDATSKQIVFITMEFKRAVSLPINVLIEAEKQTSSMVPKPTSTVIKDITRSIEWSIYYTDPF